MYFGCGLFRVSVLFFKFGRGSFSFFEVWECLLGWRGQCLVVREFGRLPGEVVRVKIL